MFLPPVPNLERDRRRSPLPMDWHHAVSACLASGMPPTLDLEPEPGGLAARESFSSPAFRRFYVPGALLPVPYSGALLPGPRTQRDRTSRSVLSHFEIRRPTTIDQSTPTHRTLNAGFSPGYPLCFPHLPRGPLLTTLFPTLSNGAPCKSFSFHTCTFLGGYRSS